MTAIESQSLDFRLLAETIQFAAEHLVESAPDLYADEDVQLADLAMLFRQIQEARRLLGDVEKELSQQCASRMDKPKSTIEGIGVLERHYATTRKNWDHDGILTRLLALSRDERQMLDEETGEFESEGSVFLRVIKEAAGIGYWRVGPLRERGLDPDEFAERGSAPPYITIRE